MENMTLEGLFRNISSVDFFAMWTISKMLDGISSGEKIYLKDISEKLNLPMNRVSQAIRKLEERGLIQWKYDGKGEDGTYIIITAIGSDTAEEQRHTIQEMHQRVIKKFGKDKFAEWQKLTAELEEVMNEEIRKNEVN